jgi:hypothetical protein
VRKLVAIALLSACTVDSRVDYLSADSLFAIRPLRDIDFDRTNGGLYTDDNDKISLFFEDEAGGRVALVRYDYQDGGYRSFSADSFKFDNKLKYAIAVVSDSSGTKDALAFGGMGGGFQYAEFGYWKRMSSAGVDYAGFAGGRDFVPQSVPTNASFHGKALGGVYFQMADSADDRSVDLAGTADLSVNGTDSTLNISFPGFYVLSFANGSFVGINDAPAPGEYKVSGYVGKMEGSSKFNYYGGAGQPEAAGVFRLQACRNDCSSIDDVVWIRGAFAGKRQ